MRHGNGRHLALIPALCVACAMLAGCRRQEEPAQAPSATLAPQAPLTRPAEDVQVAASDGATLWGTLKRTGDESAVKGGVLLLHMLGRARADWDATIDELSAAGYACLAVDIRGHGESRKGPSDVLSFRRFGAADWQAAIDDVSAARAVLIEQGGAPADKIAVIGASIGANLAMNAAADDKGIAAVILISPGLDYRGVKTFDATKRYAATERPYLAIAAQDDEESANAVEVLTGDKMGLRRCDTILPVYGGHGTDLLASRPELVDALVEWLDANLGG